MNSSITSEKNNLIQLEKKSRELQMKMEALFNVEADVQKALQQLELNEAALKKRSEVLNRIQTEQVSIDTQQTDMNELTIREQQLLRQLTAAQDKLSRLQSQQEQRRLQIGQRLKTLQEEYSIVAEERTRVMAKVDQSEKVIKDFEIKMSDLRRTHESEMVNLRSDCLLLKSQVMAYSSEVKKVL